MPVPRGVQRFESGPSGVAVVKLLKTKVKIEFEEDGSVFELPRDGVPSYMKKGGKLNIGLTTDTSRIRFARPVAGTHVSGFIGMTRADGREHPPYPVLKERKWRDKKTHVLKKIDYYGFTARMQILEGDYKGMRLFGPMEYRFTEVVEGANSIAGIWGKTARAYIRLTSFLEAGGLDWETDAIPWSDNVLPWLEEFLLGKLQPFGVTLDGKNGWPDSYAVLPKHLTKAAKTELRKVLKKLAKEAEEYDN